MLGLAVPDASALPKQLLAPGVQVSSLTATCFGNHLLVISKFRQKMNQHVGDGDASGKGQPAAAREPVQETELSGKYVYCGQADAYEQSIGRCFGHGEALLDPVRYVAAQQNILCLV